MESYLTPSQTFDKLSNFRDVTMIVNQTPHSKQLKPGILFRSARPDQATTRDRNMISQDYGIKTIVDLRTTTELLNAANEFHTHGQINNSALAPASDDALLDPLKIPGVDYAEINLNGKGFERSLLWHLSYYSLAKVIGYMLWGYRMEAVEIIGREVLQPRGLVGLAIDTIEHSQPEIKAFFELLSQDDVWPIMIHCTQGKDRTGLTVILVLLLCDIDIEAITQDYIKSEPDSKAVLQERLKDTSGIGLDESFARCPRELPARVKQHIDEKYGSVHGFLRVVGLSDAQLRSVRNILLATQGEEEQEAT